MCGIICEIVFSENSLFKDKKLLQRIKNRGPNCCRAVEIDMGNGIKVNFCGAVLWMRGPTIIPQPVESDHGLLLYNGDIFNETWDINANDTLVILEKLGQVENFADIHIINELKQLRGPFSMIYYDKHTHNLYFMRDRIGRNTLLFHKSDQSIVISSVLGRKYKCIEIPATHIYVLNVLTNTIRSHPWDNGYSVEEHVLQHWYDKIQTLQSLPDEEFTFEFDHLDDLNEGEDIVGYIESTAKETKCKLKLMEKLLEHPIIAETVTKIMELLENSIKMRLRTQPFKCKECLMKSDPCIHCTVGILFSGGLDCTILAFLSHKYVPKDQSIELMNVAFKKDDNSSYEVPDRLTGRQSFKELKALFPSRKWVFREINVSKEELEECQRTSIADLVHPRQTILDESLGSALWFAARGHDEHSVSSSRVLLIGSGADELFGGYTRHRNAYKRQNWTGLQKELYLDWKRISFRNLARDDRVISDHGRYPRAPYLEENVVDYVLNLKPWLKLVNNTFYLDII
ncbi:asparagine synthetase domain-containing protein CG17486 [Hyposmocoma kahamanoa]|uniref:asparagine synthetase domain-containing protein CG17486 n=1 Tax=Hyposmocoma kahamanoa TaxID=1477025 RepID=UPI000E6D6FC8|nr:asparagine synthetase domain-containing protein CG17486 [Hyposmocoma kahamanoa]